MRLKTKMIWCAIALAYAGMVSAQVPPTAAPNGVRTSYGLVHVRERLRTFYGPKAKLTLTRHQPHGVRATVRIPR